MSDNVQGLSEQRAVDGHPTFGIPAPPGPGRRRIGRAFAYRLVSPMIGPQTFTVLAGPDGVNAGVEVRDVHGAVTAVGAIVPTGPARGAG